MAQPAAAPRAADTAAATKSVQDPSQQPSGAAPDPGAAPQYDSGQPASAADQPDATWGASAAAAAAAGEAVTDSDAQRDELSQEAGQPAEDAVFVSHREVRRQAPKGSKRQRTAMHFFLVDLKGNETLAAVGEDQGGTFAHHAIDTDRLVPLTADLILSLSASAPCEPGMKPVMLRPLQQEMRTTCTAACRPSPSMATCPATTGGR